VHCHQGFQGPELHQTETRDSLYFEVLQTAGNGRWTETAVEVGYRLGLQTYCRGFLWGLRLNYF
jgi:hypothetical protein